LNISIHSRDIHGQSLKWCKIRPNLECFWPPKFFEEQAPIFLDLDYKIEHTFRQVAKFCGDQPTEFGDLVAKKINKELL